MFWLASKLCFDWHIFKCNADRKSIICLQNEIFILIHELEKHLDVRNVHMSFFNQHMMHEILEKYLANAVLW